MRFAILMHQIDLMKSCYNNASMHISKYVVQRFDANKLNSLCCLSWCEVLQVRHVSFLWNIDIIWKKIILNFFKTRTLNGFGVYLQWLQSVNVVTTKRIPGVVEEATVPHAVLPSGWRVEEARVGAIKLVQSILCVLGGVAVNDIQQHHNAHRMSHIYQLLQLFRGTVPTTSTNTYTDLY